MIPECHHANDFRPMLGQVLPWWAPGQGEFSLCWASGAWEMGIQSLGSAQRFSRVGEKNYRFKKKVNKWKESRRPAVLTLPEPFAWKAVLGHSVAGFLQGRWKEKTFPFVTSGSRKVGPTQGNPQTNFSQHIQGTPTGMSGRRSWQRCVGMSTGSTEEQRGVCLGQSQPEMGSGVFGRSWNLSSSENKG